MSLNVEDKYYQYFTWGKQYDIVVKCNNKEKKIRVSKNDFHEIKMGDKALCDVYYIGKKIAVIELNEHWKETS